MKCSVGCCIYCVADTAGEAVAVQIAKPSELVAQVRGDSQALGGRMQFCLAREKPTFMEELRAMAQLNMLMPFSLSAG